MGRTSDAKQKLLGVAFELIWDHSYGTVSVDDICAQAQVKKGSFYHFFESKAALAVCVYEAHWRSKQPELDLLFSPQIPPLERLTGWCEYLYRGQQAKWRQHGHVCGCPYASIGGEVATQDDKIRAKTQELMARMIKYLESAIAEARREGLVSTPNPKASANQVYSFVLGALLQAKIQNDLGVLRNLEPTIRSIIGAQRLVPAGRP